MIPDGAGNSANEWVECLNRAKDLAISQHAISHSDDNPFSDIPTTASSPASTLGSRANFADSYGVNDRTARGHLSKSNGGHDDAGPRRNRFSKRQSRNGVGPAF